jgi:hypothetical protein
MQNKKADVHTYETEFGDHYSINLKDENGKVVSTQVMKDLSEAKQVKEKWENGSYQYITES